MVDLSKLGMTGVSVSGDTVQIGAMTTHSDVANSPELKKSFKALADLASMIGDNQVRHRGTIGGATADDDPSACYPRGGAGHRRHHQDRPPQLARGGVLPGHVHHGVGAGRDHHLGEFPEFRRRRHT